MKDKCEDNVEMDLVLIGCSSWLRTVLMHGFCKHDYEPSAHIKAGNFVTTEVCIVFWRTAV